MLKVAIFFHGQPRYFVESFNKINELILKKYEVDVYCQLWWDNKLKFNGFTNWRGNHYKFHKNTVQMIIDLYKPKKISVDPPYHDDKIYDDYPNLKSYKSNSSAEDILSQFLSLKIASNMINWKNYDFILKWRYDFIPINFPDLNKLNNSMMYVSQDYHNTFIDKKNHFIDTCYILPKKGKKLFEIFDDLNKNGDGNNFMKLDITEDEYSKKLINSKLYKKLIKLNYNEFTVNYSVI